MRGGPRDILHVKIFADGESLLRSVAVGRPGEAPGPWRDLGAVRFAPIKLHGRLTTIGAFSRRLATKRLEELVGTAGDARQTEIGAVLYNALLAGSGFDPRLHGEIRIHVPLAPCALDVARIPWPFMATPRVDDPDDLRFLHDLTDDPVAVTLATGVASREVRLESKLKLLLVLPLLHHADGADRRAAEVHRDAIVQMTKAVPNKSRESEHADTVYEIAKTTEELRTGLAPGGYRPDIVYIVTHGYFEKGETFLQMEPSDSRFPDLSLVTIKKLLERLYNADGKPLLVVALACNLDSDQDSGAGATFATVVPAVLTSRIELGVTVAEAYGPRFLEYVACQRMNPAQSIAHVRHSNDLVNGDISAAWSALTLYAGYSLWRSDGVRGNARLDPQWRRDLPLFLDRAMAGTIADKCMREGRARPTERGGLLVYVLRCAGPRSAGLAEFVDRLRLELAEADVRTSVYETVMQWHGASLPSEQFPRQAALTTHLLTALQGLRPFYRTDGGAAAADIPRPVMPDEISAALAGRLDRAAERLNVLLVRHEVLASVTGGLQPAALHEEYVELWGRYVRAAAAGMRGRAVVILAMPIETSHDSSVFGGTLVAASGSPSAEKIGAFDDITTEHIRAHFADFPGVYGMLDPALPKRISEQSKGVYIDVAAQVRKSIGDL